MASRRPVPAAYHVDATRFDNHAVANLFLWFTDRRITFGFIAVAIVLLEVFNFPVPVVLLEVFFFPVAVTFT